MPASPVRATTASLYLPGSKSRMFARLMVPVAEETISGLSACSR